MLLCICLVCHTCRPQNACPNSFRYKDMPHSCLYVSDSAYSAERGRWSLPTSPDVPSTFVYSGVQPPTEARHLPCAPTPVLALMSDDSRMQHCSPRATHCIEFRFSLEVRKPCRLSQQMHRATTRCIKEGCAIDIVMLRDQNNMMRHVGVKPSVKEMNS